MPGFDFSNHTRNAALHSRGVPLPKATSTGTTIVGCIFDGGVVVCPALDMLIYCSRLACWFSLVYPASCSKLDWELQNNEQEANYMVL